MSHFSFSFLTQRDFTFFPHIFTREIPKISQLKVPQLGRLDTVADTFDEKIEMLKNPFFPPPPQVDLSDLGGYICLAPPECPVIITKLENHKLIRLAKVAQEVQHDSSDHCINDESLENQHEGVGCLNRQRA